MEQRPPPPEGDHETEDEMPTPTRRAIRRCLAAVHLPISLYMGYVGLRGLLTDRSIDFAVAPWMALAWIVILLAGAVLVVIGTAANHTRVESVGHCFHLFGLALLAAVLAAYVGVDDVVSLLALGGVSVIRMRNLRKARAASHEAARILRGERR